MATPTTFTADMLRDMAKALEDYRPHQSLMMSAGFREVLAREVPAVAAATGLCQWGYRTAADIDQDEEQ